MRYLVLAALLFPPNAPEELWEAAKKGDVEAVKSQLAKGVDVNAKTDYGATALHFAADKGNVEVVKVLLKHKADVNTKDTFYSAKPLDWALMRNRVEVVQALVEGGADGADSALRNAATTSNVKLLRALLGAAKFKQAALDSALAVVPAGKQEARELLEKAGAKAAAPATVEKSDFKAYLGHFRSESGGAVEVKTSDGKLALSFEKGTPLALVAAGKDVFKLASDDSIVCTFKRKDDKVNSLTIKVADRETVYQAAAAPTASKLPVPAEEKPAVVKAPANWPSFRGDHASGVADGQHPPTSWDGAKGTHLRWKTPIPGLGHSCPTIWGDRLFVTTAIGDPKAVFKPGVYGDVDSVDDRSVHTWKVYGLDRHTGKVLWERTACQGVPKIKRHLKGSQASPTPATDGKHVIAFFGSEGLYCYGVDGTLLWKSDLGVLSSGWFYDKDYEWGFGSSPILYRDRVIIQCDIGKDSFIAAYRLADGQQIWKTPREEIPSWGTPTIVEAPGRTELVTNATKFARGYDPASGTELWRLGKNSEITVPTPFYAQGLIFVTSGYRPIQPIYAIRPGANGDISLPKSETKSDAIAWSLSKGGPYMPTPIVYGEHLYVCTNNGMVTCYDAKTGKQIYRERLDSTGGFTASPVAADGRLYFTSETEGVFVVKAGPKFELLAVNPMSEPCMATPAISDGTIFVRSQHHVWAFGR
jgi:outer membrane protein assembly factor BamB